MTRSGAGQRAPLTARRLSTSMTASNVLQELDGSLVPIANCLTGLSLDEVFVRTDGSGAVALLTDARRSTVALADSTGTLATQYTYDAYGNVTSSGTSSASRLQFAGRENDGTGLYYYRARYYSPALGRFISDDPIGLRGGLNATVYAGGNAVSIDVPSGWSCPDGTSRE
jgi:RHS repeat-associated protein